MPAASGVTDKWFIRLQWFVEYDVIMKKINNDFLDKMLVLYHEGDDADKTPHYHMCLVLKDGKCRDTIAKWMKDVGFTLGKGNKHHSVKMWDGDEKALAYMFHEKKQVVVRNIGYSDDDIIRFKSINDSVKKVFVESRDTSTIGRCIAWAKDHGIRDRISICEHYLMCVAEVNKPYPGDFRVKNAVETILRGVMGPAEHSREMAFKLFSRG